MYILKSMFCIVAFAFVFANGNENLDEEVRVPVIDLAPWFESPVTTSSGLTDQQSDIVDQIRRACREVGFFQITGGLGGSDDVLHQTWKASKDFFDLPLEEKLEHASTDSEKYPYGYERSEKLLRGKLLDGEDDDIASENDSEAIADKKETFAIGPSDNTGSGMPPRRWVDSATVSPDFQTSMEAYYQRMEHLALTLLQIFAFALDESPDFFEDKMDHHMSALRLLHYYPLEKFPTSTSNQTSEPTQRLVRAGAHTDYGALTILAAQDKGLEVLLRDKETQRHRWYPVPLIPGAFVVNLGDLMQRWTNNEWISTMHRVVMTSTEALERRYSMAFFVNINGDTPIETLKCCRGSDDVHKNGRVITAGEHLMAKHLASMGIVTDDAEMGENVSSNLKEENCDALA